MRDAKAFGRGIHAHHMSNNGRVGAWRQCFTPARLRMLQEELGAVLYKFYGLLYLPAT